MTDAHDITGGLDLLGDFLDAKGYTEEAGLCTRAMDEINRLRDKTLEEAAQIAEKVRDDFLSEEYVVPQPIGSIQERFACNEVAAAIRAAMGESDE